MAALRSVPPAIGSAKELMAIAHALELEAARRYRELAARMRLREEKAISELFLFLASIEDKHATRILQFSPTSSSMIADPAHLSWELPENFDEEEGSSRRLTPYRALAVAVRNEDRAFSFYTYVAASAPDEPTRELAEELAKDELDHAALLRRERRKAFHAAARALAQPSSILPKTLKEFWEVQAEMEWRAAQYHHRLSTEPAISGKDSAVFALAAQEEERDARAAAAHIGLELAGRTIDGTSTLEDGLRLLEEAFDRYADIADRSQDELVLQEAQRQAAQAVRRLGLVNGTLRNTLLRNLP